jgi:hypothetical protein
MKYTTEEERKEARRLSINKYNDKAKVLKKLHYENNKDMYKEKSREYYLNNKEEIKERTKKYSNDNKDQIKENKHRYYTENLEMFKYKCREWYEKNKDNKLKYDKNYRKENRELITAKKLIYKKNRMLNDPKYKLSYSIRRTISDSIRRFNYTKKSKTFEILGCSFEEFKLHLESKFEHWMSWDNYGNPKDGVYEINKTWDIDHIIPLATVKTEEDVIKLNHYTNLQPLCSYTNRFIKKDIIS